MSVLIMFEGIIINHFIESVLALIGVFSLFIFTHLLVKLFNLKLNFYNKIQDKYMKYEQLISQQIGVYKNLATNSIFIIFGSLSGYWILYTDGVEIAFRQIPMTAALVFILVLIACVIRLFYLLNSLKKYVEKY